MFTIEETRNAFPPDSSLTAHPVVPPFQYGPFFDAITHSKVLVTHHKLSFLRMIFLHILGLTLKVTITKP